MSAIELHARRTPHYATRAARALAELRAAVAAHAGRIVQATSFGAEDMVITDLIARHRLPIAIGTLQTGLLHAETLALIKRTQARYGLTIEVIEPEPEAVRHFIAAHGERAMFESVALRQRCCAIRKVEPLTRLLSGRDAWITGMRRGQSAGRGGVALRTPDDAGRIKFSPLADWSLADVWHHIAIHDVPYNPLHDHFYTSIGCAPCTRAVAAGEDPRAGRWWWENDAAKECGLHLKPHSGAASAAPGSRSETEGGIVSATADFGHAEVKDATASGQSQNIRGLHLKPHSGAASAAPGSRSETEGGIVSTAPTPPSSGAPP